MLYFDLEATLDRIGAQFRLRNPACDLRFSVCVEQPPSRPRWAVTAEIIDQETSTEITQVLLQLPGTVSTTLEQDAIIEAKFQELEKALIRARWPGDPMPEENQPAVDQVITITELPYEFWPEGPPPWASLTPEEQQAVLVNAREMADDDNLLPKLCPECGQELP